MTSDAREGDRCGDRMPLIGPDRPDAQTGPIRRAKVAVENLGRRKVANQPLRPSLLTRGYRVIWSGSKQWCALGDHGNRRIAFV